MNNTESRIWIIRHPGNLFSRPILEDELLDIFKSGEMKPLDEICCSMGYWFSLQDVNEMRKHFGNLPLDGIFKKIKEDNTEERYSVTAPIVLPTKTKIRSIPLEESIQKQSENEVSPLMKVLIFILTLSVVTLILVWFG